MGWHGQKLPSGGSIWARGDLSGVEVHTNDGEAVKIPRNVLIDLVGEYVKSIRIRHLEQLTPRQVLGLEEHE